MTAYQMAEINRIGNRNPGAMALVYQHRDGTYVTFGKDRGEYRGRISGTFARPVPPLPEDLYARIPENTKENQK